MKLGLVDATANIRSVQPQHQTNSGDSRMREALGVDHNENGNTTVSFLQRRASHQLVTN